MAEPAPKPGRQDVTDIAIDRLPKMLQARNEFGKAKYGTCLQTWNGRNPIVDTMEELLDGFQYLTQAQLEMEEIIGGVKKLLELRTAVVNYFDTIDAIQVLKQSDFMGSISWDMQVEIQTGNMKIAQSKLTQALQETDNILINLKV